MDNHFFYFSKGERIGILVLVVLCILLFILPGFLPDRSESNPVDFSSLVAQIEAWESASTTEEGVTSGQNSEQTSSPHNFDPNQATKENLQALGLSASSIRSWLSYLRKGGTFKSWEDVEKFRALSDQEKIAIQPFLSFGGEARSADQYPVSRAEEPMMQAFNPNEVDKNTLMAMGVPEKTANNWTRFLASGGSFRKPEEMQKIYGLSLDDYQRLLPYAVLSDNLAENNLAVAENSPKAYEDTSTKIVIDINQASAEEWQQLRGIGPAFSKRITNFRDKLGGFQSVQQVSETYGLPDSVFQKIVLQLRPSPILRKLKINTATVEELATHPYLRFSDARMIVNYREEHGPYASAADLDKLYGLEEKTKQKIEPYLSFE